MNNEIKYWYLRDHKLFWVLSNEQIKQLCLISNYKKAKKGEIIYFADTDTPMIFLLKKGNIKIAEVDENGNECIKEIIQKGDLFGELSLDTSTSSNEYAEVLTSEVAICGFLLTDFEKLMERYPDLAMSYLKIVGFKFKRLKNNYSNLVFKDAKSRLIHFLKEWAVKEGKIEGNQATIPNYLTQQDIAHIICTTRQTATHLLKEFEIKGLLVYNRKEIVIPDMNNLK